MSETDKARKVSIMGRIGGIVTIVIGIIILAVSIYYYLQRPETWLLAVQRLVGVPIGFVLILIGCTILIHFIQKAKRIAK